LLITYKALILPVMSYAAPIWFPNASVTNIGRLQRVQNEALRIITGCHKMSNISHLHAECKIMLVREHLRMLCAQFLVNTKRSDHVSHEVVASRPFRRNQRETLLSKVGADVEHLLVDGITPDGTYSRVEKDRPIGKIHRYKWLFLLL